MAIRKHDEAFETFRFAIRDALIASGSGAILVASDPLGLEHAVVSVVQSLMTEDIEWVYGFLFKMQKTD